MVTKIILDAMCTAFPDIKLCMTEWKSSSHTDIHLNVFNYITYFFKKKGGGEQLAEEINTVQLII